MNEEYKELNKSDIADIKNTGGRYAGAITAALFISVSSLKKPPGFIWILPAHL